MEEECTGDGNCHGCLKWCDKCGDVAHVCDMRLRGERCDEHPIPPTGEALRKERAQAEETIQEGRRLIREGQAVLGVVMDGEIARRAYDRQRAEEEARILVWPTTPPAPKT